MAEEMEAEGTRGGGDTGEGDGNGNGDDGDCFMKDKKILLDPARSFFHGATA